MADAAPKSTFESELDSKIAAAQASYEQRSADLYGTPDDGMVHEGMQSGGAEPAPEAPQEGQAVKEVFPEQAEPVEDIVNEPPAEPEAPVQKQPPAQAKEAAPRQTREDRVNWKAARDESRAQRREIKRLQEELSRLTKGAPVAPTGAPAPAPAQAADEDDPFGYKAEIQKLRNDILTERNKTQAERQYETITNNLIRDEDLYRRTQPHGAQYDDAVNHMVKVERERYMLSGIAHKVGADLLQAAERYAEQDPRAKILLDTIQQAADRDDISDEEGAAQVACDLWIAHQRNNIITGCNARKQSIPETVWKMALAMGYQPRATAAAAAPASNGNGAPARPVNGVPQKSRAEVLRANVRATTAGKSLSNLSSSPATMPDMPAITTATQFQNFFQKDPAGARAYMQAQMKLDPNWHMKLAR